MPAVDTWDHDGVDLGVGLKDLQRIDDDGLSVQLQKLLRTGGVPHPLSGAAGKNQRDIHKFVPFLIGRSAFPAPGAA